MHPHLGPGRLRGRGNPSPLMWVDLCMDTAEFEAFVAARSGALLRFARMVTADSPDAEDVLQAALAGAFRHRRRLAASDAQRYVRRSVVNAQANRWNRRLWRERAVPIAPDLPEDDRTGWVDDRMWAVAALRALPPRQRAVLVLRYFYDLDEAAIAAELGVARGTVKSQASKALASLRAAHGDRLHEEARR